MHGSINTALADFLSERYGGEIWECVLDRAGLTGEVFVCMKSYPDEWTYKLVDTAGQALGMPTPKWLTGCPTTPSRIPISPWYVRNERKQWTRTRSLSELPTLP